MLCISFSIGRGIEGVVLLFKGSECDGYLLVMPEEN